MAPTETFRSEEAYRKWNAYRHMHGIPAPKLKKVCIKGHGCHEVNHSKRPKRSAKRNNRKKR
jgi:hypothetical protein